MHPIMGEKFDLSGQQQAAIRCELERILASAGFSGSRRSSQFITYAVEHTLRGSQEGELKERTIAVEVFGRTPGYDANEDSIVRVAARDVRKRLAQYYLEDSGNHAVRIDVPAGSYRAEFQWIDAREVETPPATPASPPSSGRRWWPRAMLSAGLVLMFGLGWTLRNATKAVPDILQQFWAPVVQSANPVLVCIGTPVVYELSSRVREAYLKMLPPEARMRPFAIPFAADQKIPGVDLLPQSNQYAGFGNVHATADLVSLLGKVAKPWQLRIAGDVSFAELRVSPAILIGSESNVWTQPLTAELRFYFSHETDTVIRDRLTPGKAWSSSVGRGPDSEDYAIVSRIIDSKTSNCLIFLGGRTQFGTQAAGELVTHAEELARGLRDAPPSWSKKNVQLVVRTQIHGLTPATPVVVAAHYW